MNCYFRNYLWQCGALEPITMLLPEASAYHVSTFFSLLLGNFG